MNYKIRVHAAYRGGREAQVDYDVTDVGSVDEAKEIARMQFEQDGEPGRISKVELVKESDHVA